MGFLVTILMFCFPTWVFAAGEVELETHKLEKPLTQISHFLSNQIIPDESRPFHLRSFAYYQQLPSPLLIGPSEKAQIYLAAQLNNRVELIKYKDLDIFSQADMLDLLNYISNKELYSYNFAKLRSFIETRFKDYHHDDISIYNVSENLLLSYKILKLWDRKHIRHRGTSSPLHYEAALMYLENLRAFNTSKPDELLMDFLESLRSSVFKISIVKELVHVLSSKENADLDAILGGRYQTDYSGESVIEQIVDLMDSYKNKMITLEPPELYQLELLGARQIHILERAHRDSIKMEIKKEIAYRIIKISFKLSEFMALQGSTFDRRFDRILSKYRAEVNNPPEPSKLERERREVSDAFMTLLRETDWIWSEPVRYGDSNVVFSKEEVTIVNSERTNVIELRGLRPIFRVVSMRKEVFGEIEYTDKSFLALVSLIPRVDGVLMSTAYTETPPEGYIQAQTTDGTFLLIKKQSLTVRPEMTHEKIMKGQFQLVRKNPPTPSTGRISVQTWTDNEILPISLNSKVRSISSSKQIRFCQNLFK